ncbi:hypothetical protein JMJ55_27665 [Belnapia sp. T6]|uniref:Uncharacterized protein n=1 Tax=Belnapia mucosa TaxID=2804532 RepID=A0ABS1VBT9_9PROT|nr:hypothetical protein [Belnapia mucosa]MBL6459108.1 hypothetical protein [Belnapia mucosa]
MTGVRAARRLPKSAGGAGEGAAASPVEVLALAQTDWLYHHLRVAGDPAEVAAFRQAAAGAGIIPWQHSLGRAEEDWFHLLVAPPPPLQRSLSLEGARILAGQLRVAAEERLRLVAERSGESRACPLDLHRLLPVPEAVLRLGPEHPEARAWLWSHWGTTEALRHVVELPVPKRGQPPRRDPGLLWLGFWSADWTPWAAIRQLRKRWPGLRLAVQPRYDDP